MSDLKENLAKAFRKEGSILTKKDPLKKKTADLEALAYQSKNIKVT